MKIIEIDGNPLPFQLEQRVWLVNQVEKMVNAAPCSLCGKVTGKLTRVYNAVQGRIIGVEIFVGGSKPKYEISDGEDSYWREDDGLWADKETAVHIASQKNKEK